jgi:predicted RNA-binding Zn-ribbon protein involved in translation (DUF1610 family)
VAIVIEFDIKYEAGHTYRERWDECEWYCPACGSGEVYADQGGGDYYVGNQHACVSCGAAFYLPSVDVQPRDWQNKQRLDALRAAFRETDAP